MSWLSGICLFACIVNLMMGSHSLMLNPKSRINQSFTILTFSFALFNLGYVGFFAANSKETVQKWYTLAAIGVSLFPAGMLHFFLSIVKLKSLLRFKPLPALLYVPGLVFIVYILTGHALVSDFRIINGYWGTILDFSNPWLVLYFLYMLSFVTAGMVLNARWYARAVHPREKKQALAIFIAGLVTIAANLFTNAFQRLLRLTIIPEIASVFSLTFLIGVFFAIRKHKFMVFSSAGLSMDALSKMFKKNPAGLAVSTKDEDRILDINDTLMSMFGILKEEAIGKTIAELNVWTKPEERKQFIRRLSSGEEVRNREVLLVRKGGEPITCLLSMDLLEYQDEDLVLCVLQDITEKKKMEKALSEAKDRAEKATRAKGELLARVSHEIRTPMNGILSMIQLLRETPISEEQGEYLNLAEASSVSLLQILNEILDYSKIEAGKLTLRIIDFQPEKLIAETCGLFEAEAKRKNLDFSVTFKGETDRTYKSDPLRIRQLLSNFLSNALKFTDTGGVSVTVGITARGPGDHVLEIRVKDTGIGISPEYRATIFKPYSQEEGKDPKRFPGTGLGLSICKQIAEQLGGGVGFTSVQDEGSEFYLTLPLG